MASLISTWERYGEDVPQEIWKKVAYACRYGHIGLREAMGLPQSALSYFCIALNEIVKEENEAAAPSAS